MHFVHEKIISQRKSKGTTDILSKKRIEQNLQSWFKRILFTIFNVQCCCFKIMSIHNRGIFYVLYLEMGESFVTLWHI